MAFRVVAVVGARPNFMKIAPLMWEIRKRTDIEACLVHTGQHYDEKMSHLFFEELRIPRPDINLEVGSGSHAVQTAEIMKRFESVVLEKKPDAVIVVGDVNSTVACAMVAVKLHVPAAHVEAGLRSFDRSMPEEINRLLTDAISDWLFVTEPSGLENLQREGVPSNKVFLVGNVMIDTLVACQTRIDASPILEQMKLAPKQFAVLTMHRPSNVDDPATLDRLMKAISQLQTTTPFVFPVHPRTRKTLLEYKGADLSNLIFTDPLGYLDFMKLVKEAKLVLTDSGGVQEETTFLKVPCLTMRENTERPVTVTHGTNRLVGMDPAKIVEEGMRVLTGTAPAGRIPDFWDGQTAKRTLDLLVDPKTYPKNI